jgi:uncharacterized membrane protein
MSRQAFNRTAIALGITAVAIAAYLTLVHYEEELLVCSVVSGCKTVQSSSYATVGSVPVALLGLIASLGMLALAVARVFVPEQRFNLSAAITGMLLFSLLYLLYLTYVELFVIDAICQWCVAYLTVTAIWFGFEVVNLRRQFVSGDEEFIED